MESSNPRVRVLPHFAMTSEMLSKDGFSMTASTIEKYRAFLADQFMDALGFFEMRQIPVTVDLDENSNEGGSKLPATSTPGASADPQTPASGFNSTLGLSESYATPGGSAPKSGVSLDHIGS